MVEFQEILSHLNRHTLGIVPTRQDQLWIGDCQHWQNGRYVQGANRGFQGVRTFVIAVCREQDGLALLAQLPQIAIRRVMCNA